MEHEKPATAPGPQARPVGKSGEDLFKEFCSDVVQIVLAASKIAIALFAAKGLIWILEAGKYKLPESIHTAIFWLHTAPIGALIVVESLTGFCRPFYEALAPHAQTVRKWVTSIKENSSKEVPRAAPFSPTPMERRSRRGKRR